MTVKSDLLLTPEFRVAGPLSIFQPNENGKYSLRALFKPGEKLTQLIVAAKKVAEEEFGSTKGITFPFHDQGDKEGYDGYEPGALFINLASGMRPGLVDEAAQRILSQDEFYPGCWAHAKVRFYSYDYKGKRGVGVGVDNIQKLRDDEPFSGRESPESAFAPIAGAKSAADVMDNEDPLSALA